MRRLSMRGLATTLLLLLTVGLSAESVKLTMYMVSGFPYPGQDAVFAEVNKLLLAKGANFQVEFKGLGWGDYEQKMQVLNASGDKYDICFTAPWMNNYGQNAAKGAFLDISELVKKHAPKTWASMPQKYWDAAKIAGKIYAIPNYQIFARTTPITVRKDLADKAGVKLPVYPKTYKTLADYEPALAAIAKIAPKDTVPVALTWNYEYNDLESIAPGVVVKLTDSKSKAISEFGSAEFKSFFDLAIKWNKAGYLKGSEMIAVKDLQAFAKTGALASSVSGTYKPGAEIDAAAGMGGNPVYVAAIGNTWATTGSVVATLLAVGKRSEHPVEALKFLELLNTDKDVYNLLNWGVEGKHYTKFADGTIELKADSDYSPGIPWELGSNFTSYIQKGQPTTVWADTIKMNEAAKGSPLLGFAFNQEPVKKEVAQVSAVWDQYKLMVVNGIGTAKDYTDLVDKVKKAGVDKIIAEADIQIADWKKTK